MSMPGLFGQATKFQHEVGTIDSVHGVKATKPCQPYQGHAVGGNQRRVLVSPQQCRIIMGAHDAIHVPEDTIAAFFGLAPALNFLAGEFHVNSIDRYARDMKTRKISRWNVQVACHRSMRNVGRSGLGRRLCWSRLHVAAARDASIKVVSRPPSRSGFMAGLLIRIDLERQISAFLGKLGGNRLSRCDWRHRKAENRYDGCATATHGTLY